MENLEEKDQARELKRSELCRKIQLCASRNDYKGMREAQLELLKLAGIEPYRGVTFKIVTREGETLWRRTTDRL